MEQENTTSTEADAIPRILLKEIPKGAKLLDIYSAVQKFGTITYIGLGGDSAVVEFADRISVGKVISNRPIKIKARAVQASHEPEWKMVVGLINRHLTFALDPDVKAIVQSKEAFDTKIADLVSIADKLTLDFDDNVEERDDKPVSHPVCAVLEELLTDELCTIVRVYPFGSRISGTALETSDLDIFIDWDDRFYSETDPDPKEQAALVETVRRRLAKAWPEFAHVTGIPKARVPIVKFLHCTSNIRCDAAFTNGLGCRNARLMRFLLSLDKRVRPLLLFLKRWAYSIDMKPIARISPRPELTSHALTMLMFTYLQTLKPPVLPPIKNVKEAAEYSLTIAGWETAFCDSSDQFRITDPEDKRSVYELSLGFLQSFQQVDWQRQAASPLDGAYVRRNLLPRRVPTKSAVIVVLDPFNLSRNLTMNVSETTMCRLYVTCALTERQMTKH